VADTKPESRLPTDTRFKPGQSGNPGGRKKGFAAAVQEKCGPDGKKLAQAAYLIAMGTPAEVRAFFGEPLRRDAKVRMQAIEWLADRGYGKAVDVVPIEGEGGSNQGKTVTFGGRYKPASSEPAA
jgi:hypothetical protein